VNACTAAVFAMGFNLGLTVLLTATLASHSPAAFSAPLEQPPALLRGRGSSGGGSGLGAGANAYSRSWLPNGQEHLGAGLTLSVEPANATERRLRGSSIDTVGLPSDSGSPTGNTRGAESSGAVRFATSASAARGVVVGASVAAVALSHRPPCANRTAAAGATQTLVAGDSHSTRSTAEAGANSTNNLNNSSRFRPLPSAAFMARRRREAEASCRSGPRGCKVRRNDNWFAPLTALLLLAPHHSSRRSSPRLIVTSMS
jgi:hypothetical protein